MVGAPPLLNPGGLFNATGRPAVRPKFPADELAIWHGRLSSPAILLAFFPVSFIHVDDPDNVCSVGSCNRSSGIFHSGGMIVGVAIEFE